ncbi:Alpha/Beta hydrolase protein [Dendryphion nanum]|uniref:Alpha/Beta hydrolase protein n=1 Tax=Dendryphion nanum TaxID=256645 RepID=A0A9P9EJ30_9PLEO|nr:Alpha/Beta hydrolase protein [Dendryphion nanum]
MTFQPPSPPPTFIHHASGQKTHYIYNSFTDPWKPAPTILIQHGFGRHSAFWYHWIPFLSRHYNIIRRDLRGHGLSSYPSPSSPYPYTLSTILSEILDTLDQLQIPAVHFLGESTSGILGEILAAKHPSRILSLTICSSPTHLPPPALDLFAFGHKDWPTACRALGSRGWTHELSKIPGTIPVSDPRYLPWYLDQISISDGEGLAGYAEFLSGLDARPYLEQIGVPMLILCPSESAAVRVVDMEDVERKVERARLVVVEGGGHEIYVTRTEVCQRAFLEFLGGLEGEKKEGDGE